MALAVTSNNLPKKKHYVKIMYKTNTRSLVRGILGHNLLGQLGKVESDVSDVTKMDVNRFGVVFNASKLQV